MANRLDNRVFETTSYLKLDTSGKYSHHPQLEWLDVNQQSPSECFLHLLLEVAILARSYYSEMNTTVNETPPGFVYSDRGFTSWVDVVLYFFLTPKLASTHGFDNSGLESGSFGRAPYGLVCIERSIFFVLCLNLTHWFTSQDTSQRGLSWHASPLDIKRYIVMYVNRSLAGNC
jgi:hypothetical protein